MLLTVLIMRDIHPGGIQGIVGARSSSDGIVEISKTCS